MSSEPASAEAFSRFRALAFSAVDTARLQSRPNERVAWFISFVNYMNIGHFTSENLNLFVDAISSASSQPQANENARVDEICQAIDYAVSSWIWRSPTIRAERMATLVAQAVPTASVIEPVSQPEAVATGLELSELVVGPAVEAVRSESQVVETLGLVRRNRLSRRSVRTRRSTRTRRPNRDRITFNYTFNRNDRENTDALDQYVRIGTLIRSDAGYNDSPIGRLEKILIEGRSAVEEYLGDNVFMDDGDTLQHAFYAIAAPSYEGKTQSAFVFGNVKPLYFVMNEHLGATTGQPIYKNFASLSRKLAELSQMDIDHLRRVKRIPRGAALDQYISASSLLDNHSDERFYVLGLFQALIIDGVLNDDYDMSWMDFYATRNRVLEIVPTSINEFLDLGDEAISQFCVFLDEFKGIDSNVFIRNLSRAAKIKVIVSNTNSNVTNLVGRPQASSSSIYPMAWSVVFTKLNTLNWNLLTQMVPDIVNLINYLKDHVQLNERPYLDKFFTQFEDVQLKKVRPGFIHLIIKAMRKFKRQNAGRLFSMEKFLCTIVRHLRAQLVIRKPSLHFRLGRLGTMALFLSNAYGPSLGSREDLLYHRKSYLRDHFFYLINPVQLSKFCFLTYRPGASEQGAPFEPDSPLLLFKDGSELEDWNPERTIFEQGEVLPFLALMGIWHRQSICKILEDANVFAQASPHTTGTAPNIAQTVPNDGDFLEVFSIVSLVNASHRNMNSSEIAFTGQSGESFLTNLIKNLMSDFNCRDNISYQVLFPEDGVTGTIISRIHVPFLFPANLLIPSMFSGLSSCVQYWNRTVHLGTIERTVNENRIDGKFGFFLKSAPAPRIPLRGICTLECKRWNTQNVDLTELRNILEKAQRNHADLSILICNSVVSKVSRKSNSFTNLKRACIDQKWEVLRVFRRGPAIFSLERFHPDICLPNTRTDYSMTFIIIELEVLGTILR